MHDRGPNHRPFGGYCGVPLQSQSQPQQQQPLGQSQQQFPHLFNPNLNPNLFIQNPYLFLQNPAAILQNHSFPIPQNLNFSIPQNPAFTVPQNSPHLIPQNPAFTVPHNSTQLIPQNPPHLISQNPPQSIPQTSTVPYQQRPNNGANGAKLQKSIVTLERVENAIVKAHNDLLATGASVSAWPVSQSALLSLQLDSWDSLGFRMQQVPSLYQLMVIEGKVNAFLHCFVGAQRITTLHDLDIALCKNECVQKFEELKLGPLLRHPLVVHYFSVPPDTKEIHKITCEEVISHLVAFMDSRKSKDVMEEMFLEFLAAKESIAVKGMLGVRIKSLRMYISCIQDARKAEEYKLKNHVQAVKQKSKKNREVLDGFLKLPPSFSEKKVLDKRFNAISQRIKSFSPIHGELSGKHVRFVSSSSEAESDDNNVDSAADSKDDNGTSNNSNISSRIRKISDQGVSSCPYPSASEEMARLCFKTKMAESSPASTSSLRCDSSERPFGRKRKSSNRIAKVSPPCKWLKTDKSKTNEVGQDLVLQEINKRPSHYTKTKAAHGSDDVVNELTLSNDAMERFITAWKDTCRVQSVSEVFERMLNFYNYNETGRRMEKKTIRKVKKIQSLFLSYPCIGLLNIAVTSIKRGMWDNLYDAIQSIGQDVPMGSAIATDFGRIDIELSSKRDAQSINENASQLECCVSVDDVLNKFAPLEVTMLEPQLVMLLSQAVSSLWESDEITKHHISMLLKKQFPMISFQVGGRDPSEDISDFLKKHEKGNSSSCVLFSATLLGTLRTQEKFVQTQQHMLENTEVKAGIGQRAGVLGSVSAKDAIECLLKAPFLTDLLSWSHWDIIFAPSLGPLMEWLSNEVRTKELLCLLTNDGKMIRIDHSVTVNEFLEALLQGSSFQTALKLLSLFSLYGGVKHFPLSLLKSHARQAIEVILKNSLDSLELEDKGDWVSSGFLCQDLFNNQYPVAAKFILDCLGHLPSEFQSFAADILLSGLRSLTKDAPMLILRECGHVNHRIMLHEIGLSLGIMEWIADYHMFSSDTTNDSTSVEVSNNKPSEPECNMGSMYKPEASETQLGSYNKSIVTVEAVDHIELYSDVGSEKDLNKVSEKTGSGSCIRVTSEQDLEQDAKLVIESIRREEFGLVPSLTHVESSILKKQHARLGRALHCLSQELYSQDSHLLLELVQNADDNVYPENVEPTLVFILQATGIVILNNEQGFSASNIRALCDVGNSTKGGSSAGYIGQKGIGFKSVFRVTDAPEIHSNGFHVKFDISDGQIGFVLPTVVSPCDIGFYERLVPCEFTHMDTNFWKTCIVLPFKSKLQEGAGMNSIVSMFSDLHPSLLLFLHRLRCIKFKNMLNDSCIVMRKETVADGIVKVSHGKEKMSWFVASQKLQASVIRPDVQTTEISIAFTLQESANGEYKPHVDLQPVFAFLPLRTYGLKFILQGDFVLPSSREEVDGDSAWNQWLLSEFPGLFVSAQQSFCALPCFEKSPGKAVAAYMSFVPLVGEIHGFFSHLPRMIISKLRVSNCLLLEGNIKEWVPPCRVLRGWNEQAYALFPETLINQYLGLSYLDKNIILSDALANALGIQEYGPKILVELVSSICNTDNGIKSMGLDWLSSCLSVLYMMLVHSSEFATVNAGAQSDLSKRLRKVPLIPLSDGTYSSVADGTIWLPSDAFSSGSEGDLGADVFPSLFAKLRTVSASLLSAASVNKNNEEETSVDNCMKMLNKIGVQRLSAHDIIREHILPAISDDRVTNRNQNLMIEYLSFVMLHLQSSCPSCCVEREDMFSELKSKAFILTNHGYRRSAEVSIHFSREFGNPVDVSKLIDATDSKWHEVDIIYLKQSRSKSLLFGLMKWREFFQELGITDFVQVLQVEKNIADVPHSVLKKMMHNVDIIPPGSILKDWECPELASLLLALSSQNHLDKCKYLLEVLDGMWDDLFSAKATGFCISNLNEDSIPLKSSFIMNIHEVQWIVSNMDQKLHYPGDLFYDCDAVRSILGAFVPYAVPQVKSRRFVSDMAFRTQVTLDDALNILQVWRRSETPFKTSIAQMCKFYSFISDGISHSKEKIVAEFSSGPSIFVPFLNFSGHEGVVHGMFLSQGEVFWHDPTGSVDRTRDMLLQCDSRNDDTSHSISVLAHVYHGLHNFFVNECSVREFPTFRSYIQILLKLSNVALPSQAADVVLRIFLKWADDLKTGIVGSEDVHYLKEFLLKMENAVLPVVRDKWVSLHPSFGLVCWCDDEELKNQFQHSDNISFLYFGELSNYEKQMLPAKITNLMQSMGVPSLSEVITREAIFYGVGDYKEKASLVNWILPFAQRYFYKAHPDKYLHFKQSRLEKLSHLQIVVVEKLFYKYALKGCKTESNKRFECSCLLQENILYMTRDSDCHTVFLELSRLFYNGTPELQLANFLHMITTMIKSGSTEDQTEFFIANSQKVPKLPNDETVWCLSSLVSSQEDCVISQLTCSSTILDEQNMLKSKRKPGINANWRPADWKTAPDFSFSRANNLWTRPTTLLPTDSLQQDDNSEGIISFTDDHGDSMGIGVDWITQDVSAAATALALQDLRTTGSQPLLMRSSYPVTGTNSSNLDLLNQAVVTLSIPDHSDTAPLALTDRDQLSFGTPNEHQAAQTGKVGEFVAFKYFIEKFGEGASINWVNQDTETGLPYDIVIEKNEGNKEYIEVKSTKSSKKDWFEISSREWQFANERGDSFSIAHVVLMDSNKAKITVFKNPMRLCQQGMLQLAVLMSRHPKDLSSVS